MALIEPPCREQRLTQGLAAFAAGVDCRPIPADARNAARRAIIDTVGVILAGRSEQPVALLADVLTGGSQARALAGGILLQTSDAALLDGVAGHVLDYDDVAQHGHPSVVIVPALFAQAQAERASGEALLNAYVVGYETWAELAWRETDAFHLGSWHPTPVLGAVAATAALCALCRLDPEQSAHALGIAASLASGVIANFGTHTKPLQVGRAAASAVEAVRFARAGLTAAADALDGAHGLLRGISPHGKVDTDAPLRAGRGPWQILEQGLSVKRYPVCYASHRAIDGVLALAQKADLRPEQVRAVTVSLGPAPAATLRYHAPSNGLEARFSLHHNLAAALVDRAVGFAQLSDGYVQRPDVAALYPLTRMEIVAPDCPDQPGMAMHDRVKVELDDGQRLDSGPIRYPQGHARQPLSEAELAAKFLDCAHHGKLAKPATLLAALQDVGKVADMRAEIALW